MTATTETRTRRSHAPWLPPQHGAWAFLGLPVALAATEAHLSWVWLLLVWAWVAAYPASYFALSMLRARRNQRFRRPLALWSVLTVVPAVGLLSVRPWLVWPLLAALVLFGVNMGYARRNQERDIVNDLVFVLQCSGMVAVSWLVGADPDPASPTGLVSALPGHVWTLTALCALVLVGSTLHVKSLLRERRDPRFALASRAVAVLSVLAGAGLAVAWGLPRGIWLVVPLAALAGRAFVRDWSRARPGQIGIVELVMFLLAVAAAALAG